MSTDFFNGVSEMISTHKGAYEVATQFETDKTNSKWTKRVGKRQNEFEVDMKSSSKWTSRRSPAPICFQVFRLGAPLDARRDRRVGGDGRNNQFFMFSFHFLAEL